VIPPGVFGLAGVLVSVGGVVGLGMVRQQPVVSLDDELALEVARRRRDRGVLAATLRALGRRAGPVYARYMSPARRDRVRARLAQAGRPEGLSVDGYAERKAGQIVLYGGGGLLLLLIGSPVAALALLAIGVLAEDIRLSRLARLRREAIDRSMPDVLDVLAVVVSAGLGFRQALGRVSTTLGGPLGEELQVALRQMDLGTPRRDAFLQMRERTGSEGLSQFVTALLQAEELGAPLAETLTELSGDQRRESAQAARVRAARAAPRVAFVVSTVIVPGAVALLVAVLYYSSALSGQSFLGGGGP